MPKVPRRPDHDDYEGRERYIDSVIRRRRREMGWSQAELGDAMRQRGFRWGQTVVHRVESGQRPLSMRETIAIADVLGIDEGAYWLRINRPAEE